VSTALDLITLALKDIGALGVGQAIGADDTADALATLNMMLGQWQGERLSVFHEIDVVAPSTGAQSYTIGPGGAFNAARPVDIKAAFARLNNGTIPVDYPVQVIRSREDYDRIALKSLSAFPEFLYYDAAYPLGNVIFYPVPNSTFELHLSVLDVLPQFTAPAQAVNLPPEYLAAIRYNLAVYLAPSYQLQPMASLVALAANAKRVVKRMNAQIPQMTMPVALLGQRGRYSIFGDNYY
jgi:hypothetical protein